MFGIELDSVPWKEITLFAGLATAGAAALLHVVFQHQRDVRKMELDNEAAEKGTNGATEKSMRDLLEIVRSLVVAIEKEQQFSQLTYKPEEWDGIVRGVAEIKLITTETKRIAGRILDRGAEEED